MRCNDFDTHIEEMLSGVLLPDATEHMRQCERCTSHYRARSVVQHSLLQLAAASAGGPSRATDRAVMESFRRHQHGRGAQRQTTLKLVEPCPETRPLTFSLRSLTPFWASRTLWSGAAAAAVVFAVLGSTVHLWHGTPTVSAPVVSAPATQAQEASVAESQSAPVTAAKVAAKASAALHRMAPGITPRTRTVLASAAQPASAERTQVSAELRREPGAPVAFGGGPSAESAPVTQLAPGTPSVMRLASTGNSSNVAQSASSTWPGYSNLMYCDPVVCSGPMQVVHIKVQVEQVKPNVGQAEKNSFVNADVVVGPDGVARAIRVAQ